MAVTKDMLISELQQLLRLTAFEQTIATIRRTQAASTPIAEELEANAAKSVERSALLQDAVGQVGGVPDVVGAALGKAGAFLQTQLNQVQTLQGALLGDLALEHQLRERTRYARTLAESLGYFQVLPVLDRLETAHTATIEWLEARLAEVGRTGTSALQATPVQAAVGVARKVMGAPFALFASGVNRGSGLLRKGASAAGETVGETVSGAAEVARSAGGKAVAAAVKTGEAVQDGAQQAGDTAQAAAQQVGDTAQAVAQQSGDTAQAAAQQAGDTAQAVAQQVGDSTKAATSEVEEAAQQVLDVDALDEGHAPFAGYATLSGDSVMRHVRDSEDVEHLREILAYEQAHKARKGVLAELESRPSELAGVGSSA